MAQTLKDVWKWETEKVVVPFCYYTEGGYKEEWRIVDRQYGKWHYPTEWLPAPSIGELRERLTYSNFIKYRNFVWVDEMDFISLARWFYDVTASADELAKVWLWVQRKKEVKP
jgi:hypothetical protein